MDIPKDTNLNIKLNEFCVRNFSDTDYFDHGLKER